MSKYKSVITAWSFIRFYARDAKTGSPWFKNWFPAIQCHFDISFKAVATTHLSRDIQLEFRLFRRQWWKQKFIKSNDNLAAASSKNMSRDFFQRIWGLHWSELLARAHSHKKESGSKS